MVKLNEYKVNNRTYYMCDDIMVIYPKIFEGSSNSRSYAKNTEIDSEYIYAKEKDGVWIVATGKCYKWDKVMIRKRWFDKKYENDERLEKVEYAPAIIDLEDEEKFKDKKGNIIEIEARGERASSRCYFKVGDVKVAFEMENLHSTIINTKADGYLENLDYKYFYFRKAGIIQKNGKKQSKKLFLTYHGLIRVLFCSRNKKTKTFLFWATDKLFIMQFGDYNDRQKLAGELVHLDIKTIQAVFNSHATSFPALYLVSLGKVGDLRKIFKIDEKYKDDDEFIKFGLAEDLPRRMKNHETGFRKYGCNITLKLFSYVDPLYLSKAESELKILLDALGVRVIAPKNIESKSEENFTELAAINNKVWRAIAEKFASVNSTYGGKSKELSKKISDKDDEIILMKEQFEKELLKKDLIIEKKNSAIEKIKSEKDLAIEKIKSEKELLSKDLIIQQMLYEKKISDLKQQNIKKK